MTPTELYVENLIKYQLSVDRPMDCPLIDYAQANIHRDLADFMADYIKLPCWGAWYAKEGLEMAIIKYEPEIQNILQCAYARSVVEQTTYPAAGPLGRAMTRLLPDLTEDARDILRVWLNA
jgi:hypothetical protein